MNTTRELYIQTDTHVVRERCQRDRNLSLFCMQIIRKWSSGGKFEQI